MPRGQDAFGKWNFHKVTYFRCPSCDKKGLHLHSIDKGKKCYGCKYCNNLYINPKLTE